MWLHQVDIDTVFYQERLLAFRDISVHKYVIELIQIAELRQGVPREFRVI